MSADEVFQAWLSTRPESIRRLAAEFPLETTVVVHGTTMFLLGYAEGDQLLVSPVDPRVDYDRAYAERQRLCAGHVRDGETEGKT